MKPIVSVVVPTRNSAQSLQACLESVASQTYTPIESIVVDNHSTDGTLAIAQRLATVTITKGPERSAQRNEAARIAQGEYVLFIDSDMVLEPTVVAECIQSYQNTTEITGVIIPERSTGEGFWAHCKALERSCYVGDDTIEAPRFFSRALFLEMNGFDETLTGEEDWDFAQRVRRRGTVGRIGAYIDHLEGAMTLRETMSAKFYYGATFGRYIRKHPGAARTQAALFRPAFFRHWRRLVAHPMLALGVFVMKMCEILAGGMGLIVASIKEWRAAKSGDALA